eukprot:jgi/Orpsp1_1/1191438/evm.model.d7180000085824.2
MLYNHKLKGKKTLKDDPQPIIGTPALKKREEDLMEEESRNRGSSESIRELHPSIISQPSITKTKREAREQRNEELITEKHNEGESQIEIEDTPMRLKDNDSEMGINLVNKKRNKDKHIKLMNQETGYNIKEDLNTIKANIAVSQLLDVSPKVRAELIKYLKLNKDESTVNLIHKGRIAISKCKIYDVPSKVYLDYGAGINLISKSYLEKLPNIPKPVGVATSSIIQVLSDVDPTPGLIYQLPLTIGNTTFETQFRLVEKEDLLFDIIISYETIVENYLFINPVTFELCKINSNLGAAQIKELFKEVKEKYELWEVVEQLEELDRSDENFSTKEGEI